MVRELVADIDPAQVTAQHPAVSAWRRKRWWLTVGIVGFVILMALEYWFDLPSISSFISEALLWFLVAWCAYGALSGQIGDRTMRWQTSALFIVVTVGVGYGLSYSRQSHGQEPALDPTTLMLAVVAGFAVANGYAEILIRERREKRLSAVLRGVSSASRDEFEPSLLFQSDSGVVWAIDPVRRALRVASSDPEEHVTSFVWDEPIQAVELRHAKSHVWFFSGEHPFDASLVVRSGHDAGSEWTYVFQFPGRYREVADRWHQIFKGWMIKDRERIQA